MLKFCLFFQPCSTLKNVDGGLVLPRFWREIFQIVASHRMPGPPILQGINEHLFTGKIHYKVNTLAGAKHMSDANVLINFALQMWEVAELRESFWASCYPHRLHSPHSFSRHHPWTSNMECFLRGLAVWTGTPMRSGRVMRSRIGKY